MMAHLLTEKEIYQQLIVALKQAETEGQPVQKICEAIQAGREVEIKLEPASTGKVRPSISV